MKHGRKPIVGMDTQMVYVGLLPLLVPKLNDERYFYRRGSCIIPPNDGVTDADKDKLWSIGKWVHGMMKVICRKLNCLIIQQGEIAQHNGDTSVDGKVDIRYLFKDTLPPRGRLEGPNWCPSWFTTRNVISSRGSHALSTFPDCGDASHLSISGSKKRMTLRDGN